jgi:hypothetical protein
MTAQKFLENFYSFRVVDTVFGSAHSSGQDAVLLAEVEQDLATASSDYLAHHYQDAINAYKQAEGLIYSHLDPAFPIGTPWLTLPRDATLFNPLLSASLEWMNILPVHEPPVAARPRIAVDPTVLAKTADVDQIGIRSTTIASRGALNTIADAEFARSLTLAGNTAAATFFQKQAQVTDPATFKLIEPPAPPAAAAPAAAAVPAGAAASGAARVAVERAAMTTATTVIKRNAVGPVTHFTIPRAKVPPAITQERSFGRAMNGKVQTFAWKAGEAPPLETVRASVYEQRVNVKDLASLIFRPSQPSDIAVYLPHAYYYVIPLGLAECYHALGDYATAEGLYFQAAAYQYLNAAIEAPYLFQRLVTLYLDWGNSLFKNDDAPGALPIYQNVLMVNGAVPGSRLYTTASLKPGADVARTVIASLANTDALTVNPTVIELVKSVHQQLLKIQGGLDYWGVWHNSVPIWTFDYLQNAAINFTQLAINAERDAINYWDRAGQANLTREQIVQSANQASAEVQAATMQAAAANAEVGAYATSVAVAQKRAQNATADANEYANLSASWIVHQALSSQLNGGDDGDASQLNNLADTMMSGPYSLSGSRATLAAAEQLTGARLNRQYEVDSLKRQAADMQGAVVQAQAELNAAKARAAASQAGIAVAKAHQQGAQALLQAFDSQTFTPDVWNMLGNRMWQLYRRYLAMALKVAKTMQQAYNFETDQSLQIIKTDYSTDEVKGFLGAESLMADIQRFTYDLITSTASKPQPIKQSISLAARYGFAFEKQFRKTGVMEFETRIDDFDYFYPGTYAGRIEAIELDVIGIVPVSGISGTLTNNGVSSYRTPASVWTDPTKNGLKYRVQSKETLVLSNYGVKQDTLVLTNDQRMMKVFEGAGVASTWRLELPKSINDIDYGALTDVVVTFYYKARYDPDLHNLVLNQLATRPGLNSRVRAIPLRWIYPDAFFHFQDTGELSIDLKATDFRFNETKPVLTSVGVLVATDGSIPPSALKIGLATPSHAAIVAQTDASGIINSDGASPWAPLAAGTAVGAYNLKMTAADNPTLVKNGKLTLTPIVNIGLILGYNFTPKA